MINVIIHCLFLWKYLGPGLPCSLCLCSHGSLKLLRQPYILPGYSTLIRNCPLVSIKEYTFSRTPVYSNSELYWGGINSRAYCYYQKTTCPSCSKFGLVFTVFSVVFTVISVIYYNYENCSERLYMSNLTVVRLYYQGRFMCFQLGVIFCYFE